MTFRGMQKCEDAETGNIITVNTQEALSFPLKYVCIIYA